MRYVFFALFWLVSLVHLYGSFRNDRHIRNLTKGCILLSLMGYYATAVGTVNYYVVGALIFSLLGDIALIFSGGFAYGGVSFMASHVFFILAYLPDIRFDAVPWFAFVLPALVYGAVAFLVLRELKPHIPKKLFWPMSFYLVCNAAMNVFAFARLCSTPCLATTITYIGAALFFVSDCILFVVRFHKTKSVWRNHFLVMLTYIIGEFLIVHGMLLLG